MLRQQTSVKRILPVLCLTLMLPAGVSHAEDFDHATAAFYNETHAFNTESDRLIKNTKQADQTLIDAARMLTVPHRAAQGLKTLDVTLSAVRQGLIAAEAVPQTREKAKRLKASLEGVSKPVRNAAVTAAKIDQATHPVREATLRTEQACGRVLKAEAGLKHVSNGYFQQVDHLVQCTHRHPNIEPTSFKIVNGTTDMYVAVDKEMKLINDKYEEATRAPAHALKALQHEIASIEGLISPVELMNGQLAPLSELLLELKHVLDQKVGVSFSYVIPNICHKSGLSAPYPCGAKTCKKWPGIKYPCGTKWCTKTVDIPYPCPKDEHVNISISVSEALQGVDAIENKIESMLSSTAWTALKAVGLGKIVGELQAKANRMVGTILSKLHLDIDVRLPKLDIAYDANLSSTALAEINKLEGVLNRFEPMLDVGNAAFKPFAFSRTLAHDAFNLALHAGCEGPAMPPPQTDVE